MTQLTLLNEPVFKVFWRPGEILEVRIITDLGRVISGYFDGFASFITALKDIETQHTGNYYVTLQVLDHRLIGRAYNRFTTGISTTADRNVTHYRWIPADIDPQRPAGVSSSDSELAEAIQVRNHIHDYLLDTTDYKIISAVSGNGGHLLIRLPEDLPANEESKTFIKSFIEGLDKGFTTDKVKVDTTVFNPARIWKLYGSKARKGDEVPGNEYREALIHRVAYIEDMGGLI